MARTPEGKLDGYFTKACKAEGALVRKLAYVGRRGATDRLVVWSVLSENTLYREGLIDFVELKDEGQKPDPHQEREHERLRALGCNVFVIDSKEAVDRYIAMRK